MRSTPFALALFLVAAGCGDDGNPSNNDGGGSGSDGGGSGSDGAVECILPDPLPACANPVNGMNVVFERIGNNGDFENGQGAGTGGPILVTAPPNDPRQFVVIRNGRIRIIENGTLLAEPFFDLDQAVQNLVSSGDRGEQGLLGLAFHPEYACNRQFFVFYTADGSPDENVVLRCTASAADPNKADTTCTAVLRIADFAGNHNGGMMEFGSDGFLYIGTGDGGGAGDPRRNGQLLNDTATGVALLGKILRIDVDNRDPGKEYAVPPSNPFAGGGGAPEIWMYGLRNPWRWSFDTATGDMWIGDVGQVKTEELTVVKAGEQSGKNLGWSIWEGDRCCQTLGINDGGPDPDTSANGCDQNGTQQTCDMNAPGLVFPQDTRLHNTWQSIIGGTTYRGTCMPDLVGWHFYTDINSTAAGLHRASIATGAYQEFDYSPNPTGMPNNITSMHHDARGEIFATTLNGNVYRLVAAP
jgi:hypothetical protein